MKVLYTTPSKPEADALVAFLAADAIDAAAVSRVNELSWVRHTFDVMLRHGEDAPRAEAALAEFLASAAQGPDDLAAQALPDLGHINRSLAPPCPSCGIKLPLDPALARCPACDAPVDVPALLVLAHGPEIMEPARRPSFPSVCARCGASRTGLPERAPCPTCGTRPPRSA